MKSKFKQIPVDLDAPVYGTIFTAAKLKGKNVRDFIQEISEKAAQKIIKKSK